MLKYRLIFGVIFAAMLVGVLYLDTRLSGGWRGGAWIAPPGTLIILLLVSIIPTALKEMQGLIASDRVHMSMRITVPACILCAIWPWLEQVAAGVNNYGHGRYEFWEFVGHWFKSVKPHYLVPTILSVATVGAFIIHARHQKVEGAIASAGANLLAIVYVGVLPGFFLPIALTYHAWMLLAIVAIVKSADIGAYATGRLFGKHKLIPWLSPGKTIEGFYGGLIASGVVGLFVASTLPLYWWQGFIMGVLLGAVGQLGDLIESLLKRDAGVKDSGKVPGFGGVLDLIDSPLLAAPVAYWLLKIMVR